MQGVEISHMNAAIEAACKAYYDFSNSSVEECLRPISHYGKKDTLGMDAGPEITICEELRRYDSGAVVITEEIGANGMDPSDVFRATNPQTFQTVFICDPTDRTNQLKEFLGTFPQDQKVKEILRDPNSSTKWAEKYGRPANITGASSAISCVRRGRPIFAVIINYISQELVVSCAAGNRIVKLPDERPEKPEHVDLDYIRKNGDLITFPGIDNKEDCMRRFVTFLGDTGKVGYMENFHDSGFMDKKDLNTYLYYGKPGGPSRVLYLSSLFTHINDKPIGFVLANGEKIGEWIHWLPFVQFGKHITDESRPALRLYEVFQDRPWTKEGILMSTPPNYSVFREFGGQMYIDTGWLLRMPNPSQLRSTLILAPHDNRWAMRNGSQSGYRLIQL